MSEENNLNFEENEWKSLKETIKTRYGAITLHKVHKLENIEIKIMKRHTDVIFLKRCKSSHLIPKGLQIKK